MQSLVYPWVVEKAGISLPFITILGILITAGGFVALCLPGWFWLVVASAALGLGYCFAAPASATILSVGMRLSFGF